MNEEQLKIQVFVNIRIVNFEINRSLYIFTDIYEHIYENRQEGYILMNLLPRGTNWQQLAAGRNNKKQERVGKICEESEGDQYNI